MKKYPNNVKKIVRMLGLSVRDFAKQLGVKPACVYNYFYENHRPSQKNVKKIVNIAAVHGKKIHMEDVNVLD